MITHDSLESSLLVRQRFEFWAESSTQPFGEWQLSFRAPSGLGFQEGSGLVGQANLLGSGSGFREFSLDLCFDLRYCSGGVQCFPVQVVLEGAQGILGLPLQDRYWILPLNTGGTTVERGAEIISLLSGQWFLVELEDRIFLKQQRVHLGQRAISLAMPASAHSTEMWWEQVSPLEAGERSRVSLNLRGPLPSGRLLLRAQSLLYLLDDWVLEPGGIRLPTSYQGDALVLELPNLGEEVYKLSGSLQALLPVEASKATVNAHYAHLQATLELPIIRTWFDFEQVQIIQMANSPQRANQIPLVLPDGSLRSVAEGGKFAVKTEGLDLLIPLTQPQNPFWIGTPLVESEFWTLEPTDWRDGPHEFFLPILKWDGELNWRLVTKSGPWFFDADAKRQILRGKIGSVQLLGREGKLKIWREEDSLLRGGQWWWFQNDQTRRGTWQAGNWSYTLELPRQEGHPSMGITYVDENWRWQLATGDLTLSYRDPNFAWGLRWSTRSLWLEFLSRQLRVEVKPNLLSFAYRPKGGPSYELQIDPAKSWQVHIQEQRWEAYLQADGWRARLKSPQAKGSWRFLTLVSGQRKNGLILAELEQRVGYVLSPQCTIYLAGSFQGSAFSDRSTQTLHFNYGIGLVYTPLPQLITELSWHKTQGWQWRSGVVVPFVGRNTGSHSE